MSKLDNLIASLFDTKDGVVACDAINGLTKLARQGNEQAKDALALYVKNGPIDHHRSFACYCLAGCVTEADVKFAKLFRDALSDSELRSSSIKGYLNVSSKAAYKEIVRIAENKRIPLESRAQAIKCLAMHSKQPFDRNLPSNPGDWKETDLRLAELKAWMKGCYPEASGYAEPKRDPALDRPRTALERIVSQLDKKLAKNREKRQDLASPTNWLSVASPADIKRIKARWKLPSVYLEFLTRFSPIEVTLASRRFYNHFQIFGANELISAQENYAYDPKTKKTFKDWPTELVLIANHGGDPFVLDLADSAGKEAPVKTAEHGIGYWKFRRVAKTFSEFLTQLAK